MLKDVDRRSNFEKNDSADLEAEQAVLNNWWHSLGPAKQDVITEAARTMAVDIHEAEAFFGGGAPEHVSQVATEINLADITRGS